MKNSDLPLTLSERVEHLKQIQSELDDLEARHFVRKRKLENAFQTLFQPLYTQRFKIVNGGSKVIKTSNEPADQGIDKPAQVIGVPNFWLIAMKSNEIVAKMIQKHDEDALRYLNDITWSRIEVTKDMYPNAKATDGFKFEFSFDPNPYFKNSVLSKTYCMLDADIDSMEKAIGTQIEWYPGKCLTNIVLNNVDLHDSFFNFFNPLEMSDDDDDAMAETLRSLEQPEYNVGVTLRDDVIPHAVSWFLVDIIRSDRNAKGNGNMNALKQIQFKHDELEGLFFQLRGQLDDDYLQHCQPLFKERCKIVNGDVEERDLSIEPADQVEVRSAKGEVPNFWLTAMKANTVVAEWIEKQDEEVLKFLEDIRLCKVKDPEVGIQKYIPTKSFMLEFDFGLNPYFRNPVLRKSYIMKIEDYPIDSLKEATGTKIEWYPGKRLTTDDSFFDFFNPPEKPDYKDTGLEEVEEWKSLMNLDYNVGLRICQDIILHAVSRFITGEATNCYQLEDYVEDDDESGDDNESDYMISEEDGDDEVGDDKESDYMV